jgi:hypothetical protein
MPVHAISYTVTVDGSSINIKSLSFSDGYKTPVTKLQFETDTASILWLGKQVIASLTVGAISGQIFTGYVDDVSYTRFPGVYEVTASNELRLAKEHWLVPASLDNPWSRSNIAAENLVRDLLAEAGLTNYSGITSGFTFGTSYPAEFSIMSVLDAIEQINTILAYTLYENNATIYWRQIFPVPSGTASFTFTNFISINKTSGTENLRNKVVVFGKDGIRAESSAVSPYLPSGFYQTAIVSSELIDSQSMADQSASYNLQLYNKLTEQLKIDIEGEPRVKARDTVHITYAPLSIDEDWFVYSLQHTFDETFTTSLILRK